MKIVSRESLSEEDDAAVLEEVAALRVLEHDNIVRLIDFVEEPRFYYLVLEYMAGGQLFDRIVSKSYYSEKVLQTAIDALPNCCLQEARDAVFIILSAIAFCHSKNIVHR